MSNTQITIETPSGHSLARRINRICKYYANLREATCSDEERAKYVRQDVQDAVERAVVVMRRDGKLTATV